MKPYKKILIPGGIQLQWELIVEPETRKIMTLEQMLSVMRAALRPDAFTAQEAGEELENADELLIGRSGEATCRSYSGNWTREGIHGTFYLDDAVADNGDGTMSAAFLSWELSGDTAQAEAWFAETAAALNDAQENLLLFGRLYQ